MPLIALTCQNRRDVTAHAGRCRNFLVYPVHGRLIGEPTLIELPPGASLHDALPGQPHALDQVQVLISASIGEGLRGKLAQRGIEAHVTQEVEPLAALRRYLDEPAGAAPRPDAASRTAGAGCGCHARHDDDDDHHHHHHHGGAAAQGAHACCQGHGDGGGHAHAGHGHADGAGSGACGQHGRGHGGGGRCCGHGAQAGHAQA